MPLLDGKSLTYLTFLHRVQQERLHGRQIHFRITTSYCSGSVSNSRCIPRGKMPRRRGAMEKCAPSLLRCICLCSDEVGQGRRSASAGRGGEARPQAGAAAVGAWCGRAGEAESGASSSMAGGEIEFRGGEVERAGADCLSPSSSSSTLRGHAGGGGTAQAAAAGARELRRVAEACSRGRRVRLHMRSWRGSVTHHYWRTRTGQGEVGAGASVA
jgi:hypothetical protein